jgi:hypothetical protein
LDNQHRAAERFDFQVPRRTGVFICHRVRDGAPVLHVSHDSDDDWQFLCGGQHGGDNPDGALLSCLECMVAGDPSLNDVADLGCNWSAARDATGEAWRRHDHFEDAILRAVEQHGWFVAKIRGGDAGQPPFAYTIGLHRSYGHAELIMVGLRLEVMHALLNACGDRIKAGERLPVGQRIAGIIDDYDVELRQVRDPASYRDHVGYGLWFNDGPVFPLLQVVWPDKTGRFPGEEGAEPILATQQPLLP